LEIIGANRQVGVGVGIHKSLINAEVQNIARAKNRGIENPSECHCIRDAVFDELITIKIQYARDKASAAHGLYDARQWGYNRVNSRVRGRNQNRGRNQKANYVKQDLTVCRSKKQGNPDLLSSCHGTGTA
jgi:hypothetical protein